MYFSFNGKYDLTIEFAGRYRTVERTCVEALMILQGIAIANLIIEVIGIMICLFGLIIIRHGGIYIKKTRRYM